MKARVILVPAVIAALAVILWTSWSELSKLDYTEIPRRAVWQLPEKVVAALDLEPGDRVADLGAGDGYFTFMLADAVGPRGRVYAVDVEEDKVNDLEAKVDIRDISNIDVVLGELDDPRLPDHGIDLVFLCNTYHHIESRDAYFSRLRTDLRPGGRVAVVDMRDDLTGIAGLFAHEGHSTARELLDQEMTLAGYRRVQSFDFLPVQLFEVFTATPDR